ncbi:MAG TPA: hypothetical protein VGB97_02330 [Candidatus Paceibacterota bacterium]|jgi:hypothetical protein
MSTIVNNPNGGNDNGAGGWIIAAVAIIVLLLLAFFLFGADDADEARDAVQNIPQQVETGVQNIDIPSPVTNTFNSTTTTVTSTTTPR